MVNISSKSIASIVRDMGVSDFLIWQVVREDIQYFLNKMWKDQFLSQTTKDKREDGTAKLLKTSSIPPTNMLCFFLKWEKFLLELKATPLACKMYWL